MTGVLSAPRLTRRTAALTLGLGGLSALFAAHPALSAKEATPAATPFPRIGHPLVGAWQWRDWQWGDPTASTLSDPSIGTFYPDGTYLTYESFEGVGIGFWRATGERTADLLVTYQTLAGAWRTLTGPEEMFEPGYVPTGHVFEIANGTITRSLRIAIEEAMPAFMASGHYVVRDASGALVYSTTTTGHAVQLVVVAAEPPATPGS
jgi:hypothetical protein